MAKSPEDRIIHLRELLNFSQAEFAKKIYITQGALSQIENKRTGLSFSTFLNICNNLNVNPSWLATGKGEIFNSTGTKKKKRRKIVRESGAGNLALVTSAALAGYPQDLHNIDFLDSNPVFRIPGYETEDCRMFEVSDNSMANTFLQSEIVIAKQLQKLADIEKNSLYIVVSADQVLLRRVYSFEKETSELVLHCDNPQYDACTVLARNVLEVWQVHAKITTEFLKPPGVTHQKLNEMEQRVTRLEEVIRKLGKKQA